MLTGTVASFDPHRGFGFITPANSKENYFFHYSGIIGGGFKALDAGTKVSFVLVEGPKGMQAVKIAKLAD